MVSGDEMRRVSPPTVVGVLIPDGVFGTVAGVPAVFNRSSVHDLWYIVQSIWFIRGVDGETHVTAVWPADEHRIHPRTVGCYHIAFTVANVERRLGVVVSKCSVEIMRVRFLQIKARSSFLTAIVGIKQWLKLEKLQHEFDGAVVIITHNATVLRKIRDDGNVVVAVSGTLLELIQLRLLIVALTSLPERIWVEVVGCADLVESIECYTVYNIMDMLLVDGFDTHFSESSPCGFNLSVTCRWFD